LEYSSYYAPHERSRQTTTIYMTF